MKRTITRVLLTSYVLLLTSYFAAAQWYDPGKVNPKAVDLYMQAMDATDQYNYQDAITAINRALKIEPKFVGAYLSLGGIYSEMKDYKSSIKYYDIAIGLDSVYANTFLLDYSISLAGDGQFQKALDAINKFLSLDKLHQSSIGAANDRKSSYQVALGYEKQHPQTSDYVFAPVNLGDNINTPDLEYYPSITID